MADVICNTSPMQYLHQVGLLMIIPSLVGPVLIPPTVDAELAVGRSLGLRGYPVTPNLYNLLLRREIQRILRQQDMPSCVRPTHPI